MKVFTHVVQVELYDYCEYDYLCPNTALVEVTDTILCDMDRGLLTQAVYVDLKKAFDTVDHVTVLKKV